METIKNNLLRLFVLLVAFCPIDIVQAQVTNGDNINAQTFLNRLDWYIDGTSGNNEAAEFFVGFKKKPEAGAAESFMDVTIPAPNMRSGDTEVRYFDIPEGQAPVSKSFNHFAFGAWNDMSEAGLAYEVISWETNSLPRNIFNGSDSRRSFFLGNTIPIDFRESDPGKLHTISNNLITFIGLSFPRSSSIDISYAWRYSAGEKSSPLSFGALSSDTLLHLNSNIRPTSQADLTIYYQDDWDHGDTTNRDVTYTFAVSDNAKRVIINTDYPETQLDTKLFLYDENDELITSDDNGGTRSGTSLLELNLCAGSYKVVVEGSGSGLFKLGVAAFPILRSINPSSFTIYPGAIDGQAACEGVVLDTIFGSAAVATIYDSAEPTTDINYHWERMIDGEWQHIATTTTTFLPPQPNLIKGDGNESFRRGVTFCSSDTIYTTPSIVISEIPSSLDPGSISVYSEGGNQGLTYALPQGAAIDSLASDTLNGVKLNAVGQPLPISYKWERSSNQGASWTNVGTNSPTYLPPVFDSNSDVLYRREATNGCGVSAFSDTVSVDIINANGTISGTVLSAPGSPGVPQAGVPNVIVTAKRISVVDGGSLVSDTYVDTTDASGEYFIDQIYYGPDEATFSVKPFRQDDTLIHVFDPEVTNVTLRLNSPNRPSTSFIDSTTFSFSGQVFQMFDGVKCGLDSVNILLNGVPVLFTDPQGNYSISIPSTGSYTIEASHPDYVFNPVSFSNLFIDQNMIGMDFENTEMQQVKIRLTNGCDDPNVGEATISFRTDPGCIIAQVTTINGLATISLPAREYIAGFTHEDPNSGINFPDRVFDITTADFDLNYRYRAQPVVEVVGLPAPPSCANEPVLEEFVPIDISIHIYEGAIGGCEVDTGTLVITDNISDKEQVEIPFKGGLLDYVLLPINPEFETEDHLKFLNVVAVDNNEQQSNPINLEVVVTGSKSRSETFTTVTPEIPLHILRDPPGDASYSYLEANESIESSTRFYSLLGGNVNTWAEVKLGTKFETGGIFFSTGTEVWGSIGTSFNVGASNTTSSEMVTSISTTDRFQTSGNPSVTGTSGDVFVGAAMNLTYSIADILTYDTMTCQFGNEVDLIMANDGFATTFIYTEQYIRENVIPSLDLLSNLTPNPDSIAFYQDQIKVWEQTLLLNQNLIERGLRSPELENISFSNNAPFDRSTTSSSSSSSTIEFVTEINTEIAAELGMEVAGSGVKGGVKTSFKMELGESETQTTTKSLTTGFYLEDDDIGDGFTVDVGVDPVYKTPVFKLRSGQSSCPWEEGTQRRDVPEIVALTPIQSNIPVNEVGVFRLQLQNASESGEDRDYRLRLVPSSNPDGAIVSIGGNPSNSFVDYSIPATPGNIEITVTVGKSPLNVFTHSGLEFELYSPCDESVSASTTISAFFESPCSDISLLSPVENWILNETTSLLDCRIADYTISDLDQIVIEYSADGNLWQSIGQVIDPSTLQGSDPSAGFTIPINFAGLEDGEYSIRAKLFCGNDVVHSNYRYGRVDRTAPQVLGIPSPIDDVYEPSNNDQIGVEYDDMIDCSSATVMLTRIGDSSPALDANLQCIDNRVVVTPILALDPAGAYRVEISDIKDDAGNLADRYRWVFIGPDYDIDSNCGELTITNNNLNQDGISQSNYKGTIIRSDGLVNSFSTITYQAEQLIQLDENFEIKSGGIFEAAIEPCGN